MKLEIYGSKEDGFHAHGSDNGEYAVRTCPFCGWRNAEISNTHSPSYQAECQNCGACGPNSTPFKRHATKTRAAVERQHKQAFEEALTLWNTREDSW